MERQLKSYEKDQLVCIIFIAGCLIVSAIGAVVVVALSYFSLIPHG